MKYRALNMLLIPLIAFLGYATLQAFAGATTKPKAVSKKGVGITTYNKEAEVWEKQVEDLKVSWHYTWGYLNPGKEPQGVQFIPMVFSNKWQADTLDAKLEEITASVKEHSQAILLGFNEPDSDEQSNVSVELALKAWPTLMKTGAKLGSPACVNAEGEWMRQFMQQAKEKKLRVDFVAVHWYGQPDVKQFITKLVRIHELYDKPIWITEFAIGDWKAKTPAENRYSPQVVQQFMKETLPKLNQIAFIERYAWFPSVPKSAALTSSSLFNEDGSLTELGKIYAKSP